jgi:hypothetical protein
MSEIENITYQDRTYVQLSEEFRQLFPTAIHAFQLIPYMYKRLTSDDGLSHKAAVTKIKEDHKDLPGFSYRNISRSLPTDSSIVPRRVVPSRHKSSHPETNQPIKLSNTKPSDSDEHSEGNPAVNEISSNQSLDCKVHIQKIQELEDINQELEDALKACSAPSTAEIQLATRGQAKKEFEIPVNVDDIIRIIQRRQQVGDLHQILVIAYLDTDSGKVLSVSVREPHDTI